MAYLKFMGNNRRAVILVTALSGSLVTATGPATYTATADSSNLAIIPVHEYGTYIITTSQTSLLVDTVLVTGNGYYRANVYLNPNTFGDGSDGDITISSNTTWLDDILSTDSVTWKKARNLTISAGAVLTMGIRNPGVIITCTGDCFIHGTLRNKLSTWMLDAVHETAVKNMYPSWMYEHVNAGQGGRGATGSGASPYCNGSEGMPARFYGGGWSGAGGGSTGYEVGVGLTQPGPGGDYTGLDYSHYFVGGVSQSPISGAGQYLGGGAGGAGLNDGETTGGSCNETGYTTSGKNGQYKVEGGVEAWSGPGGGSGNIGGGVIILRVAGQLVIDGTIDCSGNNGGRGGSRNYPSDHPCPETSFCSYQGGAGSGAGGGRIYLMSAGEMDFTGATFNVAPGFNGSGRDYNIRRGTAGQATCISLQNYRDGAGTPTILV